jgi:hypothetical protein
VSDSDTADGAEEGEMAGFISGLFSGAIDRLVRWVVLPVTSLIPGLVSKGILLLVFAALWLGFGVAIVANPAALDDIWAAITGLPLLLQAIAWLLFLPVMAGLWVWDTDWPTVVRLVVIAGIAGWNLMVFIPHRESAPAAVAEA